MTTRFEPLRALLASRAVIRGRVTLTSGVESEYYFDCKRVTLSAAGAPLVAEAVISASVYAVAAATARQYPSGRSSNANTAASCGCTVIMARQSPPRTGRA